MASENKIQQIIHKLEEGGWATWIRRAVLWAAILYITNLWFFKESGFRGLSHEKAMEQAQISRELIRGHGFSTKDIRPAALWQFQSNKGAFPLDVTPDTYHAPLNPVINAICLKAANAVRLKVYADTLKDPWAMTTKEVIYFPDRIIAAVQLLFYLAGITVSYFTAKRLFDKRLALLGMGMLLVAEVFWDFSMSGLPQMLLLFLFSCATYFLVRLIEARAAEKTTWGWAAAVGALFGLLALTHGLTIFAFGGALVFTAISLRPRGRDAAIMLAVFALFYTPWLIRNYQVCGNPLGLGWYSGLFQIRGTESQVMRTMALEGPLRDVAPAIFGEKMRGQFMAQFNNIYAYLGQIVVAPLFFLTLLHIFKKPEAATFRWCVLCMWLGALLGMCIFGVHGMDDSTGGGANRANDLHVLFIPMMTFYGLAFLLVMWSRLEIDVWLYRIAFIVFLYLVSAVPFLSQVLDLHSNPKSRVQWPPYIPPFIAILSQWTTEREIIASDMPWAVAWYADRKSLWLPMSLADFISLNDYNQLGGRMVGLYLTPVTGNKPFLREILKGEYKEWAPFILRQANIKDFPLRAVTALPVENECVFYADRDRWSTRED